MGVALARGLHAHLLQKNIEKKGKFNGGKSGRKKNVLIAPILFSYYEESVCPLHLKCNKVYFASSLIPNCTWKSLLLLYQQFYGLYNFVLYFVL